MVCGLVLETAADLQKTAAKRKDPYRFVDTGLFRVVRCPNYLGEMIFWLGVLVTGFTALQGVLQWAAALLGFALIVFIMFSGARRLEIRQDQNYGDDPEYQRYCKSVPILLPFVPLYSVKKYTFLRA
jgi:steroid 5-alpha reductase family enzyme